jgi:hypothetical protein
MLAAIMIQVASLLLCWDELGMRPYAHGVKPLDAGIGGIN